MLRILLASVLLAFAGGSVACPGMQTYTKADKPEMVVKDFSPVTVKDGDS